MRGVGELLSRLQKVRRTGEGSWIACCPAHDDRDPSLTVRDADGKILVHCFGGCSAGEIVQSVGLELDDLFPEDRTDHRGRKIRMPFNPADVLLAVAKEALVVSIVGQALKDGKAVGDEDRARMALATRRLCDAAEVSRGT